MLLFDRLHEFGFFSVFCFHIQYIVYSARYHQKEEAPRKEVDIWQMNDSELSERSRTDFEVPLAVRV